jgi:MFS family permease
MNQRTVLSVFVARILLYTPFITVAGCIPVLIEEWQISATQASFIVSGFYFTYAFSLLGFSWLGDHIGAKKSVLISAWATATSCAAFAFYAQDFVSTLILYSLIGLCQGGVYTPLIVLFRENTPAENLGTAVGWLIASTSIGYAVSIGLTGLSVGISGWRLAFLVTGLPPLIGTFILLIALKPLSNVVHLRVPGSGLWQELRKNKRARRLLGGYTSHNWELIGMWSWAPSLIAASFVLSGETTVKATQWSAQFITVMHLGGAVAAYTMGRLSDKLGRRAMLIWLGAIAAGFSFGTGWLVGFSPYLIASFVVVYSFFAIGDSPVLSTAMAESVKPSCLGAMLAVRSLAGFIVGAISPVVVGRVIDTLRAEQASDPLVWGAAFATFGLGGLCAVYFAVGLPDDRKGARLSPKT